MTIVRVQVQKLLAGGPPVGQWVTYNGAWFDASGTAPSSQVRTILNRMFVGYGPPGYSYVPVLGTAPFQLGGGQAEIKVWERIAGISTLRYTATMDTPSLAVPPTDHLIPPSQTALAIGYRSAVPGDPRRGRSRFFLGPFTLPPASYAANAAGGLRLSEYAVEELADQMQRAVLDLAGLGWVLQVKTGEGIGEIFSPAVEVYVDDVLDVMRKRRSWRTDQQRRNL